MLRKQRQISHLIIQLTFLNMQRRWLRQSERQLVWIWTWTNISSNKFYSPIGFTTENNSFSRLASYSRPTIAGLIVYNYKIRYTKTWKHCRKGVYKSTIRETPVTNYISLKLYSPIWTKTLLQISNWRC